MQYSCIKKLSVGGKKYAPGDIIPGDVFDEHPGKLISYGYIAEAKGSDTKPSTPPKKEGNQSSTKKPKNAASDDTE